MNRLAIVTASVDPTTTRPYWESWWQKASGKFDSYWVFNPSDSRDLGGFMDWFIKRKGDPSVHLAIQDGIGGVVPMFAKGVSAAVEGGADVIACLHDDLRIDQGRWDELVLQWFDRNPRTIMVGFGGAERLGDPDMYQIPYDPMTLARHDFWSNMEHAESHGKRADYAMRVSVLDGFSLIGRAEFFKKAWEELDRSGIIHHGYDAYMGCLAARAEGQVWMLPIQVHHHGGMTAVGNAKYQEWAKTVHPGGDAAFWEMAHRIVYETFRDVLPLGY